MSLSQRVLHPHVPRALAACVVGLVSLCAQAQSLPPPSNVVHLMASGDVEVVQDLLSMTLTAYEEGANAAEVQNRLQAKVDRALQLLRTQAASGQLDVRSSGFNVYPYTAGKDSKQSGWKGRAQITLEGTDFPRITKAASQVADLQISQMGFGVSKLAQQKVEKQAQDAAIQEFKTKANELSRSFGFSSYALREVHVQGGGVAMPRVAMQAPMFKGASADGAAPLQVEPGKSQVQVQLSGSIQMQ